MKHNRIAIVGLHHPEYEFIKNNFDGFIIWHQAIPQIKVIDQTLFVEKTNGVGMLPVDKMIYHGIFEDDLDFITGLVLWDGKCYPNSYGMMECRLKFPCLAKAMKHSKFAYPRGFLSRNAYINSEKELVAKWGNWHCGENKHKFTGAWENSENTVLEPFFDGEAVRILNIGNQSWQIKLDGETWLKSIHPDSATFMEIDPELLEDTLNLKKILEMDLIANDYIIGKNGEKYLLEINHIPNITRFEEVRKQYLETVLEWLKNN